MKQRLRITYGVTGPLRYVSHLDQMQVWERTARRACIPLAYSAGFNPRPQMQIAAALPVGFAAEAEWLDVWLVEPLHPQAACDALRQVVPAGLPVVCVEEVALDEPPLQTRVCAAHYAVSVANPLPAADVEQRVAALLAADTLPRARRGRAYDLRPLIEQLSVTDASPERVVLEMRLAARPSATGRPEEVLSALGLADSFFAVTRKALFVEACP
ncbi:MAG: DUF2344 domain-containing protein [Anaerolineae bacterium]|nr:DUF2344 domain-containing protein [Anaerolineae bacterium]